MLMDVKSCKTNNLSTNLMACATDLIKITTYLKCVSLKLDSETFSLVEFKCPTVYLTSYSCHSTLTLCNAVASHARSTSPVKSKEH